MVLKKLKLTLVSASVIYACHSHAQEPQWHLIPTITLSHHSADLKSKETREKNNFFLGELELNGAYKTRLQKTEFAFNGKKSQRPNLANSGYSKTDYAISQVWEDRQSSPWKIVFSEMQQDRIETEFSGGIIEDIYNSDITGNEKSRAAEVNYTSHPGALVNITGGGRIGEIRFKSDAVSSSSLNRSANISLDKKVSFFNGYVASSASMNDKTLKSDTVRLIPQDYSEVSLSVEVGKYVSENFSVLASHTGTRYQGFSSTQENTRQTHEVNSVGLTWQGSTRDRLITIRRDYDATQKKWSWGASARWQESERYRFSASWDRRFFGESGNVDFEATYGKRSFNLSASKDIDFRYLNSLISEFSGLYICPEGVIELDLALCRLPGNGTIDLKPGESLVPRFDSAPALIPRISLSTRIEAGYNDTFGTWDSRIFITKYKDSNSSNAVYQTGYNTGVVLTKRFSEREKIIISGTQRESEFVEIDSKRSDWAYSISYEKKVNPSASWSLSFHSGMQGDGPATVGLKEKRVSLTYSLTLGKRHPGKKQPRH